MAKKVLNLGRSSSATGVVSKNSSSSDSDSGSDSDSSSDNGVQAPVQRGSNDSDATDESEDDEDEEFEIPPGFDSVAGSAAITRESILSDDKELWFFKLPKHVDASVLARASFKVGTPSMAVSGTVVATVSRDGENYELRNDDPLLAGQLVNAFPTAKERKRFTLGKPFARCYSLIQQRPELQSTSGKGSDKKRAASSIEEAEERPVASPKKSKDKHTSKSAKKAKKAKTKE